MHLKSRIAGWITAVLVLTLLMSPTLGAEPDFVSERIKGADRLETAVEISKSGWTSSDTVILTTARNFPDALAGAPLAYQLDAPILMTNRDNLPDVTISEIERLDATYAIILGGEEAVSPNIQATLEEHGLKVDRIVGKNRSETAIKISEELGSYETAFLVNGYDFPDALAVAPYAARHGYPVFLTERNTLSPETEQALKAASEVYVIGGEAAVGQDIMNRVEHATRIHGKDRFETAAELIEAFNMDVSTSYVATGTEFADALTGSVLAAKHDAPILLVKLHHVPEPIANLSLSKAIILGGAQAVSQNVLEQLAPAQRDEDPDSSDASDDEVPDSDASDDTDTGQAPSIADDIIESGLKYLGTPYKFGASSSTTSVFDCSSFTQRIFRENGISLPRNSRQQSAVGTTVRSEDDLQKGDLIFFITGGGSRIDHVAVYMGDGHILHAIPRGGVQVQKLSGFWLRTAVSAKRVIE